MSDSPTLDVFPSRFSTPVNELDDHRNQPESLPRAESMGGGQGRRGTRRGTAGTIEDETRPPLLQVNGAETGSRDFEQAIVDDEPSEANYVTDKHENLARHGSNSPVMARRSPLRRPKQDDERGGSRESSASGRSVSPPDSVQAFAEPRQRARTGTAGTMQSITPSQIEDLQRRGSQGTFHRVSTLPEEKGTAHGSVRSSDQGSVEDDVCFPPEEPSQTNTVDFHELEKLLLLHRPDATTAAADRRKQSFSCRSHRIRLSGSQHDLRNKEIYSGRLKPSSMTRKPSNMDVASDSGSEDVPKPTKDPEKQPVDEPVDRWSFFSSQLQESIHAPDFADLLMPNETVENLFDLEPEGGCWWLDMLKPTDEEVETICRAFGIHGLTREDIIQQEAREKVELFKSYYFVCFRSFYQMDKTSDDYLEPVNVYAVVFRQGILTFTYSVSPHAANVRRRMGRLRDFVSLGSDWICYALIDDIVDTFGPVISSVEGETDTIEDSVFTARSEDSLQLFRQIGETRKKVMSLLRLLGGKADVIKGFAKRCNEQYSVAPRRDVGLYLSDIQDHVVTMMSNLGHFDHMLSRSHANYLAQISVDNIAQGNRANEVLSKVTFLATILVPLNLVCGLFGMNVHVPGQDDPHLYWFYGILGSIFLFLVVATAVGKKKRFI
ncbi:MAG: Mg(2+) transporter [Alyxoria varia]|nr:MAG: Mg(2+) transporter [Alyxoria varia]